MSNGQGTAELRWFYEGFIRALERFRAAEVARDDPMETFIPLFEALNWAASFELFMSEHGERLDDDLVHAIGYARNRVHHQWVEAVEIVWLFSPIAVSQPHWCWKTIEDLPAAERPDPNGAAAYPEQLARRSVRATLHSLQGIFEQHV